VLELLTARRDIQDGVFLKVFEQIRKLVKDQLDQVLRKSGRVKVHVLKYCISDGAPDNVFGWGVRVESIPLRLPKEQILRFEHTTAGSGVR
jgi:hypothetical protein